MSTKILSALRVKLCEPDLAFGSMGTQHIGWLPSDQPLPSGIGTSNIFYPVAGIAPLGYMGGGAGSGEITFQPLEDASIPVNSTITDISFTITVYLRNGLRPDTAKANFTFIQAMAQDTGNPPSVVTAGYPDEVFEPTTTLTSFTKNLKNSPLGANGWKFTLASPGDASVYLTRFGVLARDYDVKNPVIVTNAFITTTFTLPPPIILRTTDIISWTIDPNATEMDWETPGPPPNGITVPAGTYTDGTALAALIQARMDATGAAGAIDVPFFEYKTGLRNFTITFQFGPHMFYGTVLPSLDFNNGSYDGFWAYTSDPHPLADRIIVDVGTRSARLRGHINPNGATSGYPVSVYVEYYPEGFTGDRLRTTTQNLIGSSSLGVTFLMENLVPGQEYSCRIVATNADNTVYGDVETFTTLLQDVALREA